MPDKRMNTLTITEEMVSGKLLQEIALRFSLEYTTVRKLITTRIKHEVERYNGDVSTNKATCNP